jgi:hypothetical protein
LMLDWPAAQLPTGCRLHWPRSSTTCEYIHHTGLIDSEVAVDRCRCSAESQMPIFPARRLQAI